MAEDQKKKGSFSKLRLSISKKYIYPSSRARMVVLGVIGCVVIGGYFGVDSFFFDNSFISNGPLSSSHANLENNCAACHTPFSSVQSSYCSTCHEAATRLAEYYSFNAHYRATANDETQARVAHQEVPCFACHQEHQGRSASVITAPDSKCVSCHDYGSFSDRHPEFEFARTKKPDDANLIFTHINHVMGYIGGHDAEKTCSTCHSPRADGKHFDAINFESHCSDCHLSSRKSPRHLDIGAMRMPRNECAWCHVVERGNVAPIAEAQRVFTRANFDHAKHSKLKKCLECHTDIPMSREMTGSAEADQSATQNIPSVSNCQSCHRPNLNSDTCVTCHNFHPSRT